MIGLSDMMLQQGCAPQINAAHSEQIMVLTGADAKKPFTAVVEVDQDAMLAEQMSISKDRRAKRVMRFMFGNAVPTLAPNDKVATADGKNWHVVDDPQSGTLSTDYNIVEILTGKDLG
jgi:hypothetical protein